MCKETPQLSETTQKVLRNPKQHQGRKDCSSGEPQKSKKGYDLKLAVPFFFLSYIKVEVLFSKVTRIELQKRPRTITLDEHFLFTFLVGGLDSFCNLRLEKIENGTILSSWP